MTRAGSHSMPTSGHSQHVKTCVTRKVCPCMNAHYLERVLSRQAEAARGPKPACCTLALTCYPSTLQDFLNNKSVDHGQTIKINILAPFENSFAVGPNCFSLGTRSYLQWCRFQGRLNRQFLLHRKFGTACHCDPQ